MNKHWQEFKKFAVKGNVMDLAVAVIIGGAFGKIVSSLVSDVVMPLVGLIIGGVKLSAWQWVLKKEAINFEGEVTRAAITMNIGNFLQNIFDFLIISLSIFLMIKMIMKAKGVLAKEEKKEEEQKELPPPSKEEKLLTEIRDILKTKS